MMQAVVVLFLDTRPDQHLEHCVSWGSLWGFSFLLFSSRAGLNTMVINVCPALSTMLGQTVAVVQLLSHVWLSVTPWTAAHQASLPSLSPGVCSNSCPFSWRCHPTISSSVARFSSALNLFQHQVFSNESALSIRWPKYWSFSFSISPSNKYLGLISFRIDLISLLSKGLSRVFPSTAIQKHQFFEAQHALWLTVDE